MMSLFEKRFKVKYSSENDKAAELESEVTWNFSNLKVANMKKTKHELLEVT